jgi:chemotaxis protein histidine kinase CheA
MTGPTADYAHQIEELRVAYARSLPEKIRSLEEGLTTMFRDPGDETAGREAYRRIHNLVGSSGTYGFSRICEAASTLKSLVRSFLDGIASCDETFRSRAVALLVLLNRAAERLIEDGGRVSLP